MASPLWEGLSDQKEQRGLFQRTASVTQEAVEKGGEIEKRGSLPTAHRETLAPSAQDKCDSEVRHTVQMRHSFEDNGRSIHLQREGPSPDPQLRNSKDGM